MNDNITAAPLPLPLKGVEYRAFPLRDRDWDELNNWLRREYIERAKESVNGDEDLQAVMIRESLTLTWSSPSGRRVLLTVRGLFKLAQLLCREEKVKREHVEDDDSLNVIMSVFKELHFAPSEDNDDDKDSEGKAEGE